MKNEGNWSKIKRVMNKADSGEPVTIGFIGGSITQGAVASDESLCYAARVFKWWKDAFKKACISYVNAGIGATTSQFGAARISEDLLAYNPDFVIVEYSVNDNDEKPYDRADFFAETYEGLIRQIIAHNESVAILIVHSVRYDDGSNMEECHARIGAHYDIPCISMKEAIYDKIAAQETDFAIDDITQDMLHPNDYGHSIVAGVITEYLNRVKESEERYSDKISTFPKALTTNGYESVKRYNNKNITPKCDGFTADNAEQMKPFSIIFRDENVPDDVKDKGELVYSSSVRDAFKNGWMARERGSFIEFEIAGSEISLMFRKSIQKPAPVAYAILDGDVDGKIRLDANFDETWGDKAYITTILHHGENKRHTLRIEIEESKDCVRDFYLINVLVG